MASSGDTLRELGALLTSTQAGLVAAGLEDGDSLTSAAGVLDSSTQTRFVDLADAIGLRFEPEQMIQLLRVIEGARAETRAVSTLWTMPAHVAQSGALTSSLADLVRAARTSVVCSTFNFQRSSQMWGALRAAARRPGVAVRLYVDAEAGNGGGANSPTPEAVAQWLQPAVVLRTRPVGNRRLVNHAKVLIIDRRIVVVTSANFSWSAEQRNIELGLRIDDTSLADRIERELREAEEHLFEPVA